MFVASLTLCCFKVLFFPTLFFSEPIFDTVSISVHTTVGNLYTCSKLPKAAVGLHQRYPYNGLNYTDFSRKK